MEYFFTAYTKIVNNTTFYFVKKYKVYPELPGSPAIMEVLGMHVDFNRACFIAGIPEDITVREKLYKEASPELVYEAYLHSLAAKENVFLQQLHLNQFKNKNIFSKRIAIIKKSITERIPHWHLSHP